MKKAAATVFVASVLMATWAATSSSAEGSEHPASEKLKVAADGGFAPFAFKTPSGEVTGFSYDFAKEIAKRLGRPGVEMIDVNYAAIFAGLFSSRYDVIVAPTNITEERAAQMLFTEPYMPTGLGFLVKKGAKIEKLEDLKGKAVAVNNGSVSDKWAQDNEAKYGFITQRYNKNADAVQAVMIGRAFANIADAPVSRYVATQTPMAEVAYVLSTGRNFGLAVRKDEVEFRNKVENIIECMKQDGSLAALHARWFGVKPDPDSSTARIYPGYGAPGFEGHDQREHRQQCG